MISLDENKVVIKGYHGTNELTREEIIKVYGESKEFSEFNFENKGSNYSLIMENFEYHAIPLFLICLHLFDNGFMKHLERIKIYKTIFDVNFLNGKEKLEEVKKSLLINYNI